MGSRTREQVLDDAKRLHMLTPETIAALELTPIPSEAEVRERLVDYKSRVNALYDQIERWTAESGDGYTARRSGVDYLFEHYMAYWELPDEEVPLLSVYAPDGAEVLRFRPNGAWVTLTNGRVAIETPNAPPQRWRDLRLLDKSDEGRPPRWVLWGNRDSRLGSEPFNQETFIRLVKEKHESL